MPYEYPKTIEEAAQLLDKVMPDWYEKININTLCLHNSCKCILGQLYSSYITGFITIFGYSPFSADHVDDEIFGTKASVDWWCCEIIKRREPPLHDFSWALTQLKAGKYVRHPAWLVTYIKWKNEKIYWDTGLEVSGDSLKDFLNFNHFEIYEISKLCIKDLKPGDKFTFYKGGPQFTVVALENNTTSKVFYIGQDHFVAGTRCSKEVIKC